MALYLSCLSELATRYDAFILDLWGVIHDGQRLYPGVKECLAELRAREKKIVFLSNAPRRAKVAQEGLHHMGITNDLYDGIITSGEAAYQCLAHGTRPSGLRRDDNTRVVAFTPSGKHYVYIGLEKDRWILEGLDFVEAAQPETAHFVLLTHSFYDNQPKAELEPLLQSCLAARLPLLCINPDLEIVRLDVERVYCAGVVAAHYRQMGGEVIYFGKPHKAVYDASIALLPGLERPRILAVGDSLKTDIRGANANGFPSALVTGGILRDSLGRPGTAEFEERLEKLLAAEAVTPQYVLEDFTCGKR